jgi:hypothetical protein
VDKIPGRDHEKYKRHAKEDQKKEESDTFHVGHKGAPPAPGLYQDLGIMIDVISALFPDLYLALLDRPE